jgi:hypothetical protein
MRRSGGSTESIEAALRRAVEELPGNEDAWITRAELAQQTGNEAIRIASLVSAVEADPSDIELLREVAFQLCRYVNEHRLDIPKARRGLYLASVRSHMQKIADQLDATGLSRLAWLFLLEGDERSGRAYAEMGLKKQPENEHCKRLLERLLGTQQGEPYDVRL